MSFDDIIDLLDLVYNQSKQLLKGCVNIAISLNYFKDIQEEKLNDICLTNEVEYVD